ARAQVAHLDLPAAAWDAVPGRSDLAPEIALARRLNAILPRDIAITATTPAPEGFDARFSALFREYSYRLTFDRDPLDRHFALTHDPVDLGRLNEASQVLLGERDFTPFCKARPGATAIRTLEEF